MSIIRLNPDGRHADEIDALLEESPTIPGDLEIFSTWSPTDNNSVYNDACWAASMDFTGVSFYPRGSFDTIPNKGGSTIISRRHAVSAWHGSTASPVGTDVTWIAADGTRHTREVISRVQIGTTDIALLYFEGPDLPATIASYKVLPADWEDYTDYIPTTETINPSEGVIATRPPVIVLDKERQALIHEISRISPGPTTHIVYHFEGSPPLSWLYEMYGNRQNYDETLEGGDSGKPMFLLLGGELVLLGCHATVNWAPHIGGYATQINAAMLEQEAAAGETDGYQLDVVTFAWDAADRPHVQLVTQLRTTTAVTDLVGSAIYPATARQNTALPYITHFTVSDVAVNHSAGATDTNRCRIQLDCWGETYDQTNTLAAAVAACLEGWSNGDGDPAISSCHYDDGSDRPEPIIPGRDSAGFHVRHDYILWYSANP